jgi:hypothetical protein
LLKELPLAASENQISINKCVQQSNALLYAFGKLANKFTFAENFEEYALKIGTKIILQNLKKHYSNKITIQCSGH